MNDMTGRKILKSDYVFYAVRHSSSMSYRWARVIYVDDSKGRLCVLPAIKSGRWDKSTNKYNYGYRCGIKSFLYNKPLKLSWADVPSEILTVLASHKLAKEYWE